MRADSESGVIVGFVAGRLGIPSRGYGRPAWVGVLGLAVLLLVLGCRRTTPGAPSPKEELADRPDQESWDVTYQLMEDGRPRLRIRAGYMARHEEEDSTYSLLRPRSSVGKGSSVDSISADTAGQPIGRDTVAASAVVRDSVVRTVWFGDDGNQVARMRSDRLYFHEDDQRMRAVGDVVAVTPEGNRLETERLRWEEATGTVRAPGFVRLRQQGDWVEGYGLTADESFEEYTLQDPTGRVRIDEEGASGPGDESP